jgi:fructokinase
MTEKLFGGIEGGGTKFNCVVGSGPDHIVAEARIATTTPDETLNRVVDFFSPHLSRLQGVGLGSFGPFDVDPASPTYGYITTTPKPGWANTNILRSLREGLGVPVSVDMDVAAAGLGESRWGASRGLRHSLYLTIGTGVGGGAIIDGKPLHGLVSTEMGHIRIPHDREADPFSGACPYHRDCFEGLTSGPAIQARFGRPAEALGGDHPFWDMEAGYVAHALVNYIFILAPEIIILGGGVMQNEFLFNKVRMQVQALLNSYLVHDLLLKNIDRYIVPPFLGNRAGVLGGMALAMDAFG